MSGRRRGPAAGLARALLRLAEWPYTRAVAWRNRRYDRRPELVHDAGVPVVSVGNLTLGGTGKTPMVEWLARWLRGQGVRVAVVSRGYGAASGARNDEALELEQKLPDVPHVQDPDRIKAARIAVEELDCELILLDDGFQHRRIARQLDIVLLDACEPFGFDHVFPRGTLREPVEGLRRAGVVALSRADMIPPERREAIHRRAAALAPAAVWIELRHAPRALIDRFGCEEPLDQYAGVGVAAFCGIGNPAGFRHTLETCGCRVVDFREFPDHHAYARADVASLDHWASRLDAAAVLCTHKDLVKLDLDRLGGRPLRAVRVGLEILAGQEEFERALRPSVPRGTRTDPQMPP